MGNPRHEVKHSEGGFRGDSDVRRRRHSRRTDDALDGETSSSGHSRTGHTGHTARLAWKLARLANRLPVPGTNVLFFFFFDRQDMYFR